MNQRIRRAGAAVAIAALWATGCGASAATPSPTAGTAGGQDRPLDALLLEAGQLGGGREWTAGETGRSAWAGLPADRVPCGVKAIAADTEQTVRRDFRAANGAANGAAGGATVWELVVAAPGEGVQRLKRFYAECDAVGEVESVGGPATVARLAGGVQIATATDDHLLVVGGSLDEAELRRITDVARTRASGG
ncbi:hypothetical protein ACFXJ8_29380 [Nonomuraea sp. NPDC059194]|uniref:hypothetical protein n=1 Tax=Nonomuraea sp. NPDC059194 TaxID=3346764 RepID=UPI0036CED63B